jgi:GAG-pre-integrase domain
VNCKNKKFNNLTFLGDSGTSQMFTSEIPNFPTYEKITNIPQVQTADKKTVMHVVGKETVSITHEVETDSGKISTRSGALHPVYHIPGLSARLLSVRSLLAGGLSLRGDRTKINFYSGCSIVMTLKPHMVGQTIYWLNAWHMSAGHLAASSTVHEVNYDLMHHRFGHPSKNILSRASGNTKNFPSGISYPKNNPVCKECAEGKMPAQAFSKSGS